MKVLVVRTDRLGDLVLSTPVFEAIKNQRPQSEVWALISDYAAPVLTGNPFVTGVISYNQSFFSLVRALKKQNFEAAVVLHVRFKILLALFLAGISKRIGPYSKWFSFLLLTQGIRQSRSRVEKHESEYNLDLLGVLGLKPEKNLPKIFILQSLDAPVLKEFESKGFSLQAPFVAIHPGMGGSALNWPLKSYSSLVDDLLKKGHRVLLTGSVSEEGILKNISGAHSVSSSFARFLGENNAQGLEKLKVIFSKAKAVVAPSTGPLHIAAALGRPVVSFYPPILVQSAKRWGPLGSPEKIKVFTPSQQSVSTGADCMEGIKGEEVTKAVEGFL